MKQKLINKYGLNNEQADVVIDLSKELIVPAGAGSGKTKTLVNKVVHLLSEGYPLESFLVLTFTKKAANEMKIRIKRELREEGLDELVNKIDSSDISTFDSFAYNFVKQNASVLGLDSNLELLDTAIFNTYKNKIVNDIILNIMSSNDQVKKDFLVSYTDKLSADSLITEIIYLYEKLINIKPLEEFTNEELVKRIKLFNIEEDINKITDLSDDFYEDNLETLNYYFHVAKGLEYADLPANPYTKKNFNWKNAKSVKKDIEKITNPYRDFEKLNLTKKDVDDLYEQFNNDIKILFEILKLYENKLLDFKTKFNKYEFRDIANFLNEILRKDVNVLNRTKDKFKLVFVDEYQDTSLVQSDFLEMLIKDNDDIKVLYVGDIKQSIYKFRNAKPKTFINKLNTVNKIALTTNYRSSSNIIDFVNKIFKNIFDDESKYDINYLDNHYMESGSKAFSKDDMSADVFLLEMDNGETKQDLIEEAFIVGEKIKELIQSGEVKNYGDIAILSRNTKVFKVFSEVFKYLNIPLEVQVDYNLKESYLLKLIANIMMLAINLDNGDFDLKRFTYLSLARSELFGKTDDELFNSLINNGNKKSLDMDDEIYKSIRKLNNIIKTKSNIVIVNFIVNEFNVYENIINTTNHEAKLMQLDYLYQLAPILSDLDVSGVDFALFLDNFSYDEEINIKIPIVQENSDDNVVMTNIHQSKGLEYNTLFLVELNKDFSGESVSSFKYSNTSGLLIRKPMQDEKDFLVKAIIRKQVATEKKDTLKEELRLLYVAITRAEKALYILGTKKDDTYLLKSFNDYLYENGLKSFIKEENVKTYNEEIKDKAYFMNLHDDNLYYPKILDELKDKSFNYSNEVTSRHKASQTINKLISNAERQNLEQGTKLHEVLEYGTDLNTIFKNHSFNGKTLSEAKVFKELPYNYLENNKHNIGIIDLVLVFANEVYIIDYKSKDINNPNYTEQLKTYSNYLKKVYPKHNILMYLYSIIDDNLKKVEAK